MDSMRTQILTTVLILAGCGNVPPQECTPGESIACVGPGGCPGGQACNSAGSSFEECKCNPDPADAGVDLDAGIDAGTGNGGGAGGGSSVGGGTASGGGSENGGGTGAGGGSAGNGGGTGSGGAGAGTGGSGGGNNCVSGDPCMVAAQCHIGQISCASGSPVCTDMGSAPNGTMCNDGNACTMTDSCVSGTCVGSNSVSCPSPDQCHDLGVCNPATGICSNPVKPNGPSCMPSDACYTSGTCQADGSCLGTIPKCSGDVCDTGSCAQGVCGSSPKPDGTFCGTNDRCLGGVCTMCVDNVDCAPSGNPCHAGKTSCASGTSVCVDMGSLQDFSNCSDGNACTLNDWCVSGACTGHASMKTCPMPSECQSAVTCDSSTGNCDVTNKPDGMACSFGLCESGVCTCGLSGGKCCYPGGAVTACGTGLQCSVESGGPTGTCSPCGGSGQACCAYQISTAPHCFYSSPVVGDCCASGLSCDVPGGTLLCH